MKVKITQLCLTQGRILEWVDFPFSKGSSKPRDWTQVSHIAGGFFTSWATREAHIGQMKRTLLIMNAKFNKPNMLTATFNT